MGVTAGAGYQGRGFRGVLTVSRFLQVMLMMHVANRLIGVSYRAEAWQNVAAAGTYSPATPNTSALVGVRKIPPLRSLEPTRPGGLTHLRHQPFTTTQLFARHEEGQSGR